MAIIRNPESLDRRVYDYTECDGPAALASVIRYFNEKGMSIISVTQKGDQYKVFFQKGAPVRNLYVVCGGTAALETAIRYINKNGLILISVTQKDDQYKVFFRGSVP